MICFIPTSTIGCNCETTSPSPSFQLAPPPAELSDCPADTSSLVSTSQKNEVTFCYCSRLEIEGIMSLALTHEFGTLFSLLTHCDCLIVVASC